MSEFLVELVTQIRKRFSDVDSKCFQDLAFLLPENVVKYHPPSLCEVDNSFRFLHNVAKIGYVDLDWRK